LDGPASWNGFRSLTDTSGPVTLPTSGDYTLSAHSLGGAYGGTYTFSLEQILQSPIAVGTPFTGSFTGSGQIQTFAFNVTEAMPLLLDLANSGAGNRVEVYVRFGTLPTFGSYDERVTGLTTDGQSILIPKAAVGTYYVMIHAPLVPTPSDFSFTATLPSFAIRSTAFGTGGNAGNFTIHAKGAGFDRTLTAVLSGGGGVSRPAVSNWFESETECYATFDLRGLAAGNYSVTFNKGASAPVSVPNSLAVVAANAPLPVIPRLTAPSATRRGREYSFTVEWENTTLNDALPPLLTVGNTVPFGLKSGAYSLGNRYTFLGINTQGGPAGILRPGQRETMTFWAQSGTETGGYVAFVDRNGKDASRAFDWMAAISPFRPSAMTDAQASALVAEFVSTYGATEGAYHEALAMFASSEWDKIRSPQELLHHEVLRAWSRLASGVWGTVAGESPVSPGGYTVRIDGGTPAITRVTQTDRRGRFDFQDLADGQYSVAVERFTLTDPGQGSVVLTGGRSFGPVQLTVTPAAEFVLQVDMRDGTPLADAVLVPSRGEVQFDPTVTDAAGLATFRGLAAGAYDLTALDGQGEIRRVNGIVVPVTPSGTVHIDLAAATIRGAIPPGSDWLPVLVPADPGELEFMPTVVAQGQFTVQAPVGGYKLVVFDAAGHQVMQAGPWQLTAGDDIDVGLLAGGGAPPAARMPPAPAPGVRWLLDPDVYPYFSGSLNQTAIKHIEWLGRDLDKVKVLAGLSSSELIYFGRGYEYLSVVRRYMNGSGKPVFFTDGSDIVEGSWFAHGITTGMRKHPTTRQWLAEVEDVATLFVWTGIADGSLTLEPGQKVSLSILGNQFQNFLRSLGTDRQSSFYQDGNGPYQTINFVETVAGGVGHYGTPPDHLATPDKRYVEGGTIVVSRDCDGIYSARLQHVKLHVHDAWDLWPGNLAGPPINYITTLLAFLEINNVARDVVLDIVWTDREVHELYLESERPECIVNCKIEDSRKCIDRPASWDPNDIIGPAGVGSQHHVASAMVMPYTIRFENHATTATAPAAMVTVKQKLDPDLDWTSFKLGNLGFGSTVVEFPTNTAFYETRVDLTATRGVVVDVRAGINMATGGAYWEMTALDPVTGILPEDPFAGFLPPNATAPEGEGFVTYTILPKRPGVSGTRIDALATIVFDVNDPIITPAIFHTLDDGPPSLAMDFTHTGAGGTNLVVRWPGDDRGGAGIARYDVEMSLNGGAFLPWHTNTQLTQATYQGYFGQQLEFRVTVRDFLGQTTTATAGTVIIDDDYLHWRSERFGTAVDDPAQRNSLWGDDADPDGDGRSNLYEFLAATDPKVADSQFNPTTRTEGGDIIYSYRQTKVANHLVNAKLQWSPDGIHWFTGGMVSRVTGDYDGYRQLEAVLALNGQTGVRFRYSADRDVVYSHWIYEEGAPFAVRGSAHDANGDGLNNALAYAFGLPAVGRVPATDMARLPKAVVDWHDTDPAKHRGGIEFRVPDPMQTDVTLVIESSPSLAAGTWSEVARRSGSGGWIYNSPRHPAARSQTAAGLATVTFTEDLTARRFYRMRALVVE
jgi:hypothetical protein